LACLTQEGLVMLADDIDAARGREMPGFLDDESAGLRPDASAGKPRAKSR
jgi:hypothetical protein